MMATTVAAPEWLSATAREWFEAMLAAYSFDGDPAGTELLTAAAAQLDRLQVCRESISDVGPLIRDRFGQVKPHPCLVEERAASNLFRLLVRELGLQAADPAEPRIPRGY